MFRARHSRRFLAVRPCEAKKAQHMGFHCAVLLSSNRAPDQRVMRQQAGRPTQLPTMPACPRAGCARAAWRPAAASGRTGHTAARAAGRISSDDTGNAAAKSSRSRAKPARDMPQPGQGIPVKCCSGQLHPSTEAVRYAPANSAPKDKQGADARSSRRFISPCRSRGTRGTRRRCILVQHAPSRGSR